MFKKEELELIQHATVGLYLLNAISGDCPSDTFAPEIDGCKGATYNCMTCWKQAAEKSELATICLEALSFLGIDFTECPTQVYGAIDKGEDSICSSVRGDKCARCWIKATNNALEELK